ncbi:hypothetical protein [Tenacibaculum agarivorans]|uniref:hypothetical protein n=1 Tax=Tenacibaculum agarivorans TaxID=1908389 RepID=UPI00117BF8E8|nr:hypothetical protein [Tenacibaculum agarivorans]
MRGKVRLNIKALIVIFLCFKGVLSLGAQASYRIEFFNLNYRINKGVKNRTSSNINIEIHYANGTKRNLYYRPIRNRGDNENNFKITPFIAYSRPVKITCFAFVNFRTGTDANGTKTVNFSNDCVEGSFDEGYSPRMTHIRFSYRIYPIIKLTQPTDNNIAPNQYFNTRATSGFLAPTYRKWEYKLGNGAWKYVPNASGSVLIKRPQDFLSGNYIGQYIRFRIKTCNTNYNSTIVSYYLIDNPPPIISHSVTKTRCNYTSDGGITLNFQRPLRTNEKMLIALYFENTVGSNSFYFYKSFSTTNLSYDGTNYSYTFPENLDAGNYQVKYQTVNRNLGEENWTSLTARNVKINETAQVNFNITKRSDKTCFVRDDGYIEINANGEKGRTFFYQYLKGGVLQTIAGQSWIPFSNPNTTRISGLGEYTYRIQVRDSNNCYAR